MSAVAVTGHLVHYEKLGRGRPVVLVHGWIGSWRYWIPLMRQLQLKYVVYAVDLYGYGDSSREPERYSLLQQVDLLRGFMDELGLKKAAFVGHGLGAMAVARFAHDFPHRVARMMLVSAPLFEVPDLKNRPMPDQQRVLTGSNSTNPFPGVDALSPEERAAPPEDATLLSRPGVRDGKLGSMKAAGAPADPTVQSTSRDTIVRPTDINRDLLRQQAIEEGLPVMKGEAALGASGRGTIQRANNPLSRTLQGDPMSILARCFKRSDAQFEKLQQDVAKMDDRAMHFSAEYFDAGEMLDMLRLIKSIMVIVHGEDDPIIPVPSAQVWDYLTLENDKRVATVPVPGTRHFPMLEYEPFTRMVTSFLETSDLDRLDMKERWRRRTR